MNKKYAESSYDGGVLRLGGERDGDRTTPKKKHLTKKNKMLTR